MLTTVPVKVNAMIVRQGNENWKERTVKKFGWGEVVEAGLLIKMTRNESREKMSTGEDFKTNIQSH